MVKGSNYLEALSQATYVVMDKTGTLTEGVFDVTQISPVGVSAHELIKYAAYAECFSNHPISRSIKMAYGQDIDESQVSDIEEISGQGVKALFLNKKVAAGNYKLMNAMGIECNNPDEAGTIIHVAIDNVYSGYILISDRIKASSKAAIAALKKAGVKKTVMLTGDARHVAEKVAGQLNIDTVYSELLPADKVSRVEELLKAKKDKEVLLFVGDGINDAPVLTRADVGIAMGALGSDAAIEAADVVLMDDDPLKIATAIGISRKCMGICNENIYFAIGIKVLCLVFGALGIANMWWAIFADVGVMVLAVLNAIRAMRVKSL